MVKSVVLGTSFLSSVVIGLFVSMTVSPAAAAYLLLTQIFGFISLTLLFLVLLPGPLYRLFPQAPFFIEHRKYLGPLGISTFYFALLHACISFWGLYEGFSGLMYLPTRYLLAACFGFIALLILAALAGTSFDYARIKMGANWKRLHRTIYIGGFAAASHIAMSGTHFKEGADPIGLIGITFFAVIVFLNAITFNRYLSEKYPTVPPLLLTFLIALGIGMGVYILDALHLYAHLGHE